MGEIVNKATLHSWKAENEALVELKNAARRISVILGNMGVEKLVKRIRTAVLKAQDIWKPLSVGGNREMGRYAYMYVRVYVCIFVSLQSIHLQMYLNIRW